MIPINAKSVNYIIQTLHQTIFFIQIDKNVSFFLYLKVKVFHFFVLITLCETSRIDISKNAKKNYTIIDCCGAVTLWGFGQRQEFERLNDEIGHRIVGGTAAETLDRLPIVPADVVFAADPDLMDCAETRIGHHLPRQQEVGGEKPALRHQQPKNPLAPLS